MRMILENVVVSPPEEWWFLRTMRRVWFSVALILLVAGLLMLRRYRFERVPGGPEMGLTELRGMVPIPPRGVEWTSGPGLRLVAGVDRPHVVFRTELPELATVSALHIRFRMAARELVPGKEEWEDGRLLIEWFSPDGKSPQEIDPFGSIRGDDASGEVSIVVRPASSPAVPVLRVENLGRSGTFDISMLELTPVRERTAWKVGRWLLLGAWFLWLYGVLAGPMKQILWRRCLAAAIWVTMGVFCVFPGPWKTLRPMILPFDLGQAVEFVPKQVRSGDDVSLSPHSTIEAKRPEVVESIGKVQPSENWILMLKRVLVNGRPLLHMLLLFGPTLAFAWLLGEKQAAYLGGSLALAIEVAQTAFGYGFDLVDVGDLASDAAGIVLALWVWQRIAKKVEGNEHRTFNA